MSVTQTEYRDDSRPLKAEIVEIIGQPDGRSHLVLLVNIEGQPRKVLLSLDALQDHGLTGPAAAKELRAIREQLSSIADLHLKHLELLASQPDLNKRLGEVVKFLAGIQSAIERRPRK